jgi:hypothetical protein
LIQNKRKNSASSCETEHPEKIRVISPSSEIHNFNDDISNYKRKSKSSPSKTAASSSCDESIIGEKKRNSRDKFDVCILET